MADPTTEHADLRKMAENPRLVLGSRDAGPWLSKNLLSLLDDITRLRAERDEARATARSGNEAISRLIGERAADAGRFQRDNLKLEDRATSAEAQRDALAKALERQADNMAFVLNRVELHGWHDKFERELAEDREALARTTGGGA